MLEAGAQIEKYEVLAHLGGGGFAEVYRVRHVHLGTVHALKILKQEHVANEQIRLRFLDEARVQAQLVHPNIARVTDIIVSQGVAGLVMEYLEGGSLADFIEERQGPASEDEILAIMLPILEALHLAHERGVIHRDIKPDNIFLAVDNKGAQIPKLLDFGIAKIQGELRQGGKRKSTVATGMGTEGYASPEQLRSAADVDRRADIFSLGVTLYEIATGRLPFERDSEVDSLMALMNGDYEIPEQLRRRSPGLALAIGKALHTDREKRYPHARALGQALRGSPPERLQVERQRLLSVLRSRSAYLARADAPVAVVSARGSGPAPAQAKASPAVLSVGFRSSPASKPDAVREAVSGGTRSIEVVVRVDPGAGVKVLLDAQHLASGDFETGFSGTERIAPSSNARTIWVHGGTLRKTSSFALPPLTVRGTGALGLNVKRLWTGVVGVDACLPGGKVIPLAVKPEMHPVGSFLVGTVKFILRWLLLLGLLWFLLALASEC